MKKFVCYICGREVWGDLRPYKCECCGGNEFYTIDPPTPEEEEAFELKEWQRGGLAHPHEFIKKRSTERVVW